jgi:hypothetical protein
MATLDAEDKDWMLKVLAPAIRSGIVKDLTAILFGSRLAAVQVTGSAVQYLVGAGLFWPVPSMAVLNVLRKANIAHDATVTVTQAELDILRAVCPTLSLSASLAGVSSKLDQLLGRPIADVDETAIAEQLKPYLSEFTDEDIVKVAQKLREAITDGSFVFTPSFAEPAKPPVEPEPGQSGA